MACLTQSQTLRKLEQHALSLTKKNEKKLFVCGFTEDEAKKRAIKESYNEDEMVCFGT